MTSLTESILESMDAVRIEEGILNIPELTEPFNNITDLDVVLSTLILNGACKDEHDAIGNKLQPGDLVMVIAPKKLANSQVKLIPGVVKGCRSKAMEITVALDAMKGGAHVRGVITCAPQQILKISAAMVANAND